ncbi:MAG: HPP family protein [Desulfobia sp.]
MIIGSFGASAVLIYGATALIAVIGSAKIHALGFWYVLVPAGLGAALMLAVALLVNNIAPCRRYPEFWL